MDNQHELFCVADPLFYDSPTSRAGHSDFEVANAELPDGWQRFVRDLWVAHVPPGCRVPSQGWKIHVSACRDNAEEVLAKVWDYCRSRQVSFKFLRSPLALHMRNAKYAPRDASGKFITIYPLDEPDLERICNELGAILAGQPGPTILSDLRIGAGPLHVRYGGFAERWCEDGTGELVVARQVAHACCRAFAFASRKGTSLSTCGSFGRPSTRSPMMFFMISSVPPAMWMPGAESHAFAHTPASGASSPSSTLC